MKNTEITGLSEIHMLAFRNSGQHYKFLMRIGRVMPTTKAQARHFISSGPVLDVLAGKDVNYICNLFARNGFDSPKFRYTKSKKFVRLITDIEPILRKEFNL